MNGNGDMIEQPHDKHGEIDLSKAIELSCIRGYKDIEISRYFGVTRQAVSQALNPIRKKLPGADSVKAYNKNFSHFLQCLDMKISMAMLDDETIKKASLNNLAYAFSQVRHQRLLDEGKATQNIAYKDVTKEAAKVETQMKKLLEEHPELEALED